MYVDLGDRFVNSLHTYTHTHTTVVWSPHKKKDVTKIENIQRAATKMVPELKDLT